MLEIKDDERCPKGSCAWLYFCATGRKRFVCLGRDFGAFGSFTRTTMKSEVTAAIKFGPRFVVFLKSVVDYWRVLIEVMEQEIDVFGHCWCDGKQNIY